MFFLHGNILDYKPVINNVHGTAVAHHAFRAPASPKKAGAIFVANWGPLGAKLKIK